MKTKTASGAKSVILLAAILVVTLVALFHKSLSPEQTLFANDGPLGVLKADYYKAPDGFLGVWDNTHWIGMYGGHFFAIPTYGLLWLFGPVGFSKFYAPATVLILGACAWIFFRQIGCNSRAAILAAIAAALNMNFFSNAAWGLGTRGLSLGATFLALAAIEAGMSIQPILTSVLAGLAVGLSILEGGDNGAIFSVFVGFFAVWRVWSPAPSWRTFAIAAGKAAIVVVFAAIMASPTITASFRAAGKDVVTSQQEVETAEQKWDFATQWSLPRIETLRVIIPGLFGYRMDTPDGGNYWGRVGEAPRAAQQMPRYSGAGEYAGVLVVLIGVWAIVEAFRRKGQTFSAVERKLVLFWAAAAVAAMLLGWGRHGLLEGRLGFRLVHMLPYFKDMRNAMKFFHAFHLCVIILFGYGLLGLSRRFLDVQLKPGSILDQLKSWWNKASPEKAWTLGCLAAVAVSAVAWFGYLGSRSTLVKHLQESGFPDATVAAQIARFSTNEVLLFVVFLAVSVAILSLILSGALSGTRATWAGVLIGFVLVVDLARADMPWIIYYNWKEKYASNAIIDLLKERPYEHRVAVLPFQLNQQFGMLQQFYHVEWLQHHFPFYNVQSLDMPQDPRPAADKQAFRQSVNNIGRLWQLTNTRYLFGLAGPMPDMLNQQLDPVHKGFRQHTAFTLFQKPNGTFGVETNASGPFALLEFTGALPRARLYHDWEVFTDEKALLTRLGDTNWNPAQTVLVFGDAPKPTAMTADPGKAEIVSAPSTKEMRIKTASDSPAMLLLNDKIEPEWQAYLDGKKVPVMRANYLMRSVNVPAGAHEIVFKCEMKPTQLAIVGTCDLLGLLLVGWVTARTRRQRS